jgi:hypothetical protein
MAHLIDGDANWIGETDILVQTGDIVDRGTYALDIYRMMQRLRGQAAGAGGQVVSILGNHEVMNAIGDWRWVLLEVTLTLADMSRKKTSLALAPQPRECMRSRQRDG